MLEGTQGLQRSPRCSAVGQPEAANGVADGPHHHTSIVADPQLLASSVNDLDHPTAKPANELTSCQSSMGVHALLLVDDKHTASGRNDDIPVINQRMRDQASCPINVATQASAASPTADTIAQHATRSDPHCHEGLADSSLMTTSAACGRAMAGGSSRTAAHGEEGQRLAAHDCESQDGAADRTTMQPTSSCAACCVSTVPSSAAAPSSSCAEHKRRPPHENAALASRRTGLEEPSSTERCPAVASMCLDSSMPRSEVRHGVSAAHQPVIGREEPSLTNSILSVMRSCVDSAVAPPEACRNAAAAHHPPMTGCQQPPHTNSFPASAAHQPGVVAGAVVVFVIGHYIDPPGDRVIYAKAKAMGIRSYVLGGPGRLLRVTGGPHLGRWALGVNAPNSDVSWLHDMEAEGLIEQFMCVSFDAAERVFEDSWQAVLRVRELAGRVDCVTTFTELMVPLATRLSEAMGLRGNPLHAALTARNKFATRLALSAAGVSSPRYALLPDSTALPAAAAHVGFPAVLKPVSGAASIGVVRVDNFQQLASAFDRLTDEMSRFRSSPGEADAPSCSSPQQLDQNRFTHFDTTPSCPCGPDCRCCGSTTGGCPACSCCNSSGCLACACKPSSSGFPNAGASCCGSAGCSSRSLNHATGALAASNDIPDDTHGHFDGRGETCNHHIPDETHVHFNGRSEACSASSGAVGALYGMRCTADGAGSVASPNTALANRWRGNDAPVGRSAVWVDLSLMLEEYMGGHEVDCDIVMSDGVVVFSSVTDNWPTAEPDFNETGGNCPSVLPQRQQRELVALAVQSLQALQFHSGAFHVECKYTAHGPQLIEVNARVGGGYTRMVNQLVWGVDLDEAHLLALVGSPLPRPPPDAPPRTAVAALMVHATKSGTLQHVDYFGGWAVHPDVVFIRPKVQPGQQCHTAGGGECTATWLYEVMVQRPTVQEAIDLVRKIQLDVQPPIC